MAPDCRPDLAGALVDVAALLGRLARWEDALGYSREAIGIYRGLAPSRPATFRTKLAEALTESVEELRHLGRHPEGLQAAQEAVAILRESASPDAPATLSQLAGALVGRAIEESTLGYEQQGEAHFREAIGICESMVTTDVHVQIQLAGAYNDAAAFMRERPGRLNEAYRYASLAHSIISPIAQTHRRFRVLQEIVLDTLAACLADLRRPREAVACGEQAYRICYELFRERPLVFRDKYALTLNNYSQYLIDNGQIQEALGRLHEAMALVRGLAASRPDAYRGDLARVLRNIAHLLVELQRPWEAHPLSTESVMIYYDLALTQPGSYRLEYAHTLNVHAAILFGCGQLQSAREAAGAALHICQESIAGQHAEEGVYAVLAELGRLLDALGLRREARTARTLAGERS